MAGLLVSLGNIVALGTLLFRIDSMYKKASSEYQDLMSIIESTQLCVESTRYSIESIYHSLPAIHRVSLGQAVAGVRDVAVAISNDFEPTFSNPASQDNTVWAMPIYQEYLMRLEIRLCFEALLRARESKVI